MDFELTKIPSDIYFKDNIFIPNDIFNNIQSISVDINEITARKDAINIHLIQIILDDYISFALKNESCQKIIINGIKNILDLYNSYDDFWRNSGVSNIIGTTMLRYHIEENLLIPLTSILCRIFIHTFYYKIYKSFDYNKHTLEDLLKSSISHKMSHYDSFFKICDLYYCEQSKTINIKQ